MAAQAPGVEPNAENKLFVGGCPSGCKEEDLRQLFEQHGTVEEVFVMRGGSRSGMECAFVRFATQPMAQKAIDAIHGMHTLPDASEPLVVRWADAPGSRKREGREGSRRRGGGGGGGANNAGYGMMGYGGMGYPNFQMQQMMFMQQQQAASNPLGPSGFYSQQQGGMPNGGFGGSGMQGNMMGAYPPPMMAYMGNQVMAPQWNMQGGYQGPSSPQQQAIQVFSMGMRP